MSEKKKFGNGKTQCACNNNEDAALDSVNRMVAGSELFVLSHTKGAHVDLHKSREVRRTVKIKLPFGTSLAKKWQNRKLAEDAVNGKKATTDPS